MKSKSKNPNESIAYLRIKGVGDYALSKPIHRPPLPPKNFLIRLSKEKIEEIEKKKLFKEAEAKCVETKTGARFCVIKFDNVELEGVEFCSPTYKYKVMIERKELPTILECREKGKNWFLVIRCKPEEFCKGSSNVWWEIVKKTREIDELRKEIPRKTYDEVFASTIIERCVDISREVAHGMALSDPKLYTDFGYIHEKYEKLGRDIEDYRKVLR